MISYFYSIIAMFNIFEIELWLVFPFCFEDYYPILFSIKLSEQMLNLVIDLVWWTGDILSEISVEYKLNSDLSFCLNVYIFISTPLDFFRNVWLSSEMYLPLIIKTPFWIEYNLRILLPPPWSSLSLSLPFDHSLHFHEHMYAWVFVLSVCSSIHFYACSILRRKWFHPCYISDLHIYFL